jgi:NDP-sugar pyrophosphorylase family protein
LVASGQMGAVLAHGPFMDIGTPESYDAAEHFVADAARL